MTCAAIVEVGSILMFFVTIRVVIIIVSINFIRVSIIICASYRFIIKLFICLVVFIFMVNVMFFIVPMCVPSTANWRRTRQKMADTLRC